MAFMARPWPARNLAEGSDAKRPNVQVGDPFLEKLLLGSCLEAMQTGAIVGIQDMVLPGDVFYLRNGWAWRRGHEIELDLVPQRETAYSLRIMLSERRSGCCLGGGKGREGRSFPVFSKWGLDAVTIGPGYRELGVCGCLSTVSCCRYPNAALTDDAPLYNRPMKRWEPPVFREKPESIELATSRISLRT